MLVFWWVQDWWWLVIDNYPKDLCMVYLPIFTHIYPYLPYPRDPASPKRRMAIMEPKYYVTICVSFRWLDTPCSSSDNMTSGCLGIKIKRNVGTSFFKVTFEFPQMEATFSALKPGHGYGCFTRSRLEHGKYTYTDTHKILGRIVYLPTKIYLRKINHSWCSWIGKYTKKSHWYFLGFSRIDVMMWVFPKIMVPPNHPLKNRVFHYKPSILGVFPLFLETPMWE